MRVFKFRILRPRELKINQQLKIDQLLSIDHISNLRKRAIVVPIQFGVILINIIRLLARGVIAHGP